MNERLRTLRLDRGWTQQQLADAVRTEVLRATGQHCAVDSAWVGRLERGAIKWPGAQYRAALRTVLGGATDAVLGLAGSRTVIGSAKAAIEPAAGHFEQLRRSLVGSVSDGALSNMVIDDFEQMVVRYGLLSRDHPAGLLLEDLTADLAQVQSLIERPRALSTAFALTRLAANMCGLICLTLVKLDRRPEFRRWARVARVAARETGDSATVSWVLAQEAYGHYYADDLEEALAAARDAQSATTGGRGVGAVLAAALEARILGTQGNRQGCVRAIGLAEERLGMLPADQVNDSAFGYDEGQLRFHEGNAYTRLGDTAAAWLAQQRALELTGAADYMDQALTRLDRATCLVADGDTATGLAYAADTMSALEDQQRAGIISLRGKQLLATLESSQGRKLPAAALLRDRLMTFDSTAGRP
ncbi:helix-turn-helix domain-containing protein [Actinospica robiniae]|uniref:helix-turn-helix domain-containing protein n=1 Tax=Actinospica robiniae TaxID=304901 RepID=UPI000688D4EC|nr:helix-turn-helix domain-containing protein [Actinospica robiniae]